MMTYAKAMTLMANVSGWTRSEIDHDPDSALWVASGELVEARNVIREAKQQRKTSR